MVRFAEHTQRNPRLIECLTLENVVFSLAYMLINNSECVVRLGNDFSRR